MFPDVVPAIVGAVRFSLLPLMKRGQANFIFKIMRTGMIDRECPCTG